MKKLILLAFLPLLLMACSGNEGKVTINLPSDYSGKTLVVSHLTIDNIYKAKQQEDLKVKYDTLAVNNHVATLKLDRDGESWYLIESPELSMENVEFFASPKDELTVDIKSFNPLDYKVSGSQLMEDMMAYRAVTNPIQQEYLTLVTTKEDVTEEELNAIMGRYDGAIKKFVAENPDSPVVPYVITELSGDDFHAIYSKLSPAAKKSMLMPYAELYNRQVEDMLKDREAEETRQAEVASGNITAPNFTLPDLNGKKVSLSDFRGKWVVLDFWGSWCGWCVKGFPALKEAYAKYGDKIVVIGIDCNESEEDWRAGVKANQLPWLNLYNGNDRKLYEEYKIEGFPTKVIVNPEGKIVDLTTGEDPEFYSRLARLISVGVRN